MFEIMIRCVMHAFFASHLKLSEILDERPGFLPSLFWQARQGLLHHLLIRRDLRLQRIHAETRFLLVA